MCKMDGYIFIQIHSAEIKIKSNESFLLLKMINKLFCRNLQNIAFLYFDFINSAGKLKNIANTYRPLCRL